MASRSLGLDRGDSRLLPSRWIVRKLVELVDESVANHAAFTMFEAGGSSDDACFARLAATSSQGSIPSRIRGSARRWHRRASAIKPGSVRATPHRDQLPCRGRCRLRRGSSKALDVVDIPSARPGPAAKVRGSGTPRPRPGVARSPRRRATGSEQPAAQQSAAGWGDGEVDRVVDRAVLAPSVAQGAVQLEVAPGGGVEQ